MIAIIDNYDSFTYNLYQYIGEINANVRVYRNDKISIDELEALPLTHLIISPGPGYPQQAGISIDAIKRIGQRVPTLGVCLGHQAIGAAFGGNIVHARQLVHGKAHDIALYKSPLFDGVGDIMRAGRYHSLVVEKETLPDVLAVTAQSADGEIMAMRHKQLPIFGLQFHPESILTPDGKRILRNFLELRRTGS